MVWLSEWDSLLPWAGSWAPSSSSFMTTSQASDVVINEFMADNDDGITDEDEDLTQGNVVKVLEVVSGELLLVEKLKK